MVDSTMRCTVIGACAILAIPFSAVTANEHPIELDSRVTPVEFRSPGRAVRLGNGDFGAVSMGQYLTSKDDGKTWAKAGEIPTPKGPAADGGLLVSDGKSGLVLVHRDDASMILERTPDNMPLPGARLQVWCISSDDGGKSWTNHTRLIDGFCGAMIDGIHTSKGRFVIPLQELRYNPPRHVTVVFRSADGGRSWNRRRDLDIGGHGIEDGCFEATITERADTSLLMFLRTTRDAIWRSESNDGGVTWTAPTPTNIAASNSPAFLLTLAGGHLALVWNPVSPTDGRPWPRRIKPRYAEKPDSVYREELQFALSDDGGYSWTEPVVIARQPGARLRYAYLIENKPGEIRMALRGKWYDLSERTFILP